MFFEFFFSFIYKQIQLPCLIASFLPDVMAAILVDS